MKLKKIAGFICLAGLAGQAHAGLAELTFDSEVERQSAQIILQTYNDLIENAGCFDDMQGPASTETGQSNGRAACDGGTYQLFTKMRALVQTASQISGDEANTEFSLGLNLGDLNKALRWASPEEYAAQKSLSRDFIKEQLSGLGARVTALRLGATGFSGVNDQSYAYNQSHPAGGGASADDNSDGFSRLGGFLNFSLSKGDKSATNLEDAFDFDGNRVNTGLDYRVSQYVVFGATLGYSDQTVDFNRSKSTADGKIVTDGYSFMPFVLVQAEQFYVSLSIGSQQQHFDTERVIHYPGTDAQTNSKTDSHILITSAEVGYSFQHNQFAFEPFANFNSSATKIDKFVETDKDNSALNVAVDGQKIKSIIYGYGFNLRYTFTPSFGVVTPFASIQQLTQANNADNVIGSHYVNSGGSADTFHLPGDTPDKSYRVLAVGVSSVLRGAHQETDGGPAVGGLQGFVNYKTIQGLRDYSLGTIELGLRYEF